MSNRHSRVYLIELNNHFAATAAAVIAIINETH